MNDNIAVNSFFLYAGLGLEKSNLSIIEVHKRIIDSCCFCVENADKRVTETSKRLLAVYDTMRLLGFLGRQNETLAVYAIYFSTHGRKPRKNELHLRVLRHAYEQSCDIRTVYRQLRYAKKLFDFVYNHNNNENL